MRWEMSVEADAEVVPGAPSDRKLAAIKALCRERVGEPIQPYEILQIIEAEES